MIQFYVTSYTYIHTHSLLLLYIHSPHWLLIRFEDPYSVALPCVHVNLCVCMCMLVYICVCIYIILHVFMHASHACMHVRLMHVCTCISWALNIHRCTFAWNWESKNVIMYAPLKDTRLIHGAYIHAYMHAYIPTHTHTYIHILKRITEFRYL